MPKYEYDLDDLEDAGFRSRNSVDAKLLPQPEVTLLDLMEEGGVASDVRNQLKILGIPLAKDKESNHANYIAALVTGDADSEIPLIFVRRYMFGCSGHQTWAEDQFHEEAIAANLDYRLISYMGEIDLRNSLASIYRRLLAAGKPAVDNSTIIDVSPIESLKQLPSREAAVDSMIIDVEAEPVK